VNLARRGRVVKRDDRRVRGRMDDTGMDDTGMDDTGMDGTGHDDPGHGTGEGAG
jgi:hypothetical protein